MATRLGAALMRHYAEKRPPADYDALLKDICNRVRDAAAQASNKPALHVFGSNKSGFLSYPADVDFSLVFRSYSELLHGIPRFDEQNSKRFVTFSKALAAQGMSQVRYVEARIPVVSFVDEASGLHCDVTIGNLTAVRNSAMLKLIHDFHPIVPLYIHSVKAWAKAKEVIAPEKSCFNSFTVTTMALMVLQELSILPVFSKPTGAYGELTESDVENALKGFARPPFEASNEAAMTAGLEFLLLRFAQYYSAFDFATGTVSLIVPRRIRPLYGEAATHYVKALFDAKAKAWEDYSTANNLGPVAKDELDASYRSEMVQRPTTSPVVVEDFSNFVNCGRRLTVARLPHVKACFNALREGLESQQWSVDQLLAETNLLNKTHIDTNAQKRVRNF